MILDGGNRYRACIESGVEPRFDTFDGDSVVSFVLSSNMHRRHLSPGQQAAIVSSAQDWSKAQAVGKPKSGDATGLRTVDQRRALSGAGDQTQRLADKLAKADPELARKVAYRAPEGGIAFNQNGVLSPLVLENTLASGVRTRQSCGFLSPIGFAQWAGWAEYNTRKGNQAAVLLRFSTPARLA